MEQIKKYLSEWSAARIIRLLLASLLGIAYAYNGESLYLFAGFILCSISAVRVETATQELTKAQSH